MLPRSTRETGALELGFLADRVLGALKAVRKKAVTPTHLETLRQAAKLMQELSDNVGPAGARDMRLTFNAVHSFAYAAEALRAVPPAHMRDGLRRLFATLAGNLTQLANAENLSPQGIKLVDEFFRRLSDATFEHWSALGGESVPRKPEFA